MQFSPCTAPGRQAASAAAAAFAALGLTLSAPAALAEPAAPAQAAGDQTATDPASPGGQATGGPDEPLTFLDSVTVTATLRPAPVRDTPGMVSVIDDVAIEERLVQNMADLVKYEPGVYVENNVTRLGLNGFNIRGIGGNRVMTQVDGVQTSEQFDFGPFNVHQVSLDIDTLKSVEIVRSANSALYGSDALGGVVSLFTKDPGDYLRGRRFHAGAKTTWDGRADGLSGNLSLAAGTERFQASLFASATRGNEIRNKGTVETADDSRTTPNPQDLVGSQMLAKIVFNASPGNMLRASAEVYDTRVETAVLSQQGSAQFSPTFRIDTTDYDAVDTQERLRLSIDHTLVDRGGFDQLSWRIYGQRNDTSQVVDDARTTFGFGPPMGSLRNGSVDFDQAGYGTSAQGQKWLGDPEGGVVFSFGASYKTDHFDVLRDAREVNARSGAVIPSRLIYPTKYFPESDVAEAGAYLQGEIQLGRLTLVPGVRYDHFTLDADQADSVFLASLNPVPADFSADAVSPKFGIAARLSDVVTVHAQYAGGFRAPPYSNINTGFTNFRGGYTTLPNAALRAETSDNVEVGIRSAFARASFDLTTFLNYYDDFIELTSLGFNPRTRLLEFQSQNLEQAEIKGVEMRGEAYLSDSVTLRGSYAHIRGVAITKDVTVPPLAQETPLGSVAPNEGVLGLRYTRPSGRWGGEISVRMVESYQQVAIDGVDEDQFSPDGYAIVDLIGFASLMEDLTFRLGLLNLTDAKYFEWWNVRGRPADDPVIDRYSSPGISLVASLAYDW